MFGSHPDRLWWLETPQTPTVWSPPSLLHPSLKRTSPAWPDWTTTEPAPRYMCLQFTIVLFTIYICIIQDNLLTSPTSCWPHITEATLILLGQFLWETLKSSWRELSSWNYFELWTIVMHKILSDVTVVRLCPKYVRTCFKLVLFFGVNRIIILWCTLRSETDICLCKDSWTISRTNKGPERLVAQSVFSGAQTFLWFDSVRWKNTLKFPSNSLFGVFLLILIKDFISNNH